MIYFVGNHRAFVFKKLQFKYISVCKINYFDKNVQLRYWYRLLKNIRGVDFLKRMAEDMNGSVTQVRDKQALKKHWRIIVLHGAFRRPIIMHP
jgi:hypothetical protein